MNRLHCCLTLGLVLVASYALAEELKSGLKPGAGIGPFDVVKCAGAEKDGVEVGKSLCYRCKYGSRPMVMVFTRKPNEQLVSLVKELDQAVEKHSEKDLKAFVNVLGAEREKAEADTKKFAKTSGAKNVPFVVPVESENGPEDYSINPKAEVTVIVAAEGKVVATHAFAAGKLDKDAAKAILADVQKLVK